MCNGLKGPVRFFIFFIGLLFSGNSSFAQTRAIDSLRTSLKTERMDTMRVKTLGFLAYDFYLKEAYDSALKYANQALTLADTLKFKKGMEWSEENLGLIAIDQGNYTDALQVYLKAYQLANEIQLQKAIARAANGLGLVCYYTGDYPTALKYYFESLKIKEKWGYKPALTTAYNNIVDVYKEEGNLDEAKVYLFKKLAIDNEIKDTVDMGYAYFSLGELYMNTGKLDSAMYCENKANLFGEIEKNKVVITYSGTYKGEVLLKQGKYEDALSEFQKTLVIADSINDKERIAMLYYDMGDADVKLHRFPDACNFYAKSLDLAKKISDKKQIMRSYLALTHYDSVSGNQDAVLDHYKMYITYRDSIFNVSNARKIENEKISYDFENKRELEKAETDSKMALEKEESERKIQRQKILRDVFIGGFGLALVFSTVFFRQRVRIGKEKKRSEDLLLNILPEETAEELKEKGSTVAKSYDMVTVIFTDFKNFTKTSENLSPQELVNEINYCYSEFDRIVTRFGIEKIKTIGDGYMAQADCPLQIQPMR